MKNDSNPKFAFFGTPELAVEILDELKSSGRLPAIIITAPDKPKGRLLALTPPPVKDWAVKNKIPVLQPEKINDEFFDTFKNYNLDFGIVVAYGKILTKPFLESLPLGFFNIHYSLLPRHRGATPVESAILSGDAETGVSIQKIVLELDAGPIAAVEKTDIDANETALDSRKRLNDIAKKLLLKTIPDIENGKIQVTKQDTNAVTRCKKIQKENGLIRLSDDGLLNYRKYRAYFGWPGVYFFENRNGKNVRVNVKKALFADGKFIIETVVPEGKKEMAYGVWQKSVGAVF